MKHREKKKFKKEKIISELQGNIRKPNKHVTGFLEGGERQDKKTAFTIFNFF